MFSILLISLGLNTALMFILAGLASVFYGTPAQPIFSTIAVFTVFFDLILPFILLWAHFNRADSTRRPPRYPRRPVGDEAGLDEATARWHLLEALEKHAAVFSYLAAAEQREKRAAPSEADRALTAMEQRQVKNNIYRYQHPYDTDEAALASDWQNVGDDMRLATARFITTTFNGDEVEKHSDGTWYMPRLKLHIEADGSTWKEV
jgi:hypothetical protein